MPRSWTGVTWRTPAVDITAKTRLKPMHGGGPAAHEAYLPAIGGGIQTKSGRLVQLADSLLLQYI